MIKNYVIPVLMSILFVACSNDDNDTNNGDPLTEANKAALVGTWILEDQTATATATTTFTSGGTRGNGNQTNDRSGK